MRKSYRLVLSLHGGCFTRGRHRAVGTERCELSPLIISSLHRRCRRWRRLTRVYTPFLVSGWSTLTEDLRRGSNWLSGGSSKTWQTSADLSPPLRRSSVSVDHPLTRKGIMRRMYIIQSGDGVVAVSRHRLQGPALQGAVRTLLSRSHQSLHCR